MEYTFKNVKVNCKVFGQGNKLYVFLHGWGASLNLMLPYANNFSNEAVCLLIDFPPFGNSQQPLEPWALEDYVELTRQLIDLTKQTHQTLSTTIFGHSFGGRIAICLAATSEVNNLVLFASAGLKPKFSIKRQINIWRFRHYRKIGSPKANKFGSADYKVLSPVMQQTFKNIVNLDLKETCKKISAKTVIIFGSADGETPLYMGKKLKKLIPKSSLFIIEGAGHFAYLNNFQEVFQIVNTFLKLNN